jgi:16S rRNA (guanine527-N7)-methyltransferase
MFHVEHILRNFFDIKDLEPFFFLEKEYFKWVSKINISSIKTKESFWLNHVFDSLCLLRYLKEENIDFSNFYDLGSGAGFPGLIVSILSCEKITLVEPIKKKTDFSSHIARHLNLENLKILNVKYQNLDIVKSKNTVVAARALGDFDNVVRKFKNKANIIFMTSFKEAKKIEDKEYLMKGHRIYSDLSKYVNKKLSNKTFVCF